MVPACTLMGISLGSSGLAVLLPQTLQLPCVLGLYLVAGTAGGFYLIPLSSFIQVRPYAQEKGRVQGISYFLAFSGLLISGQLFLFIGELSPAVGMAMVGGFSVMAALLWYLIKRAWHDRVDDISEHNVTLSGSIFTPEL